jgi:hypothetical protein
MSCGDLLTSGDTRCLASCHLRFVSKSCHFFRTPLPIPWRHIQSLRNADQPVRKVPSRDGCPRGSSRVVQLRGDERPSSTMHQVASIVDNLYRLSGIANRKTAAPLLRPIARPLDPQKMALIHFRRSRPVVGRSVAVLDVHRRAGRSPSCITCGPKVVPIGRPHFPPTADAGLLLVHSVNGFRLHQTAVHLESQTQLGDIPWP